MIEGELLLVVEVLEIYDTEQAEWYRTQARQQFVRFGGSLVARGAETFEGPPAPHGVLIQRWPSEAAFRAWQESDDYRPLFEVRKKAMSTRITMVPLLS